MTENTMIRELTDDELLMISGGQRVSVEACRNNVQPLITWDSRATFAQNVWGIAVGVQMFLRCINGGPNTYLG
jgi:hypothetical protein